MAIDTAAKRRCVAGIAFLPLTPGVTPDAAQPVEWRIQAAWGYSGITPASISLLMVHLKKGGLRGFGTLSS